MVMTKEEKATAATCSLSCLEHLISICAWAQTFLNDRYIAEVLLKSFHKEITIVKGHLNVRMIRDFVRYNSFSLSIHIA